MEENLYLQGEINNNISANGVCMMITPCASGTTEAAEIPLP